MLNNINSNNILKIEEVTKSYDKHIVLNKISLEINEGDVYGLIGPNGAGKTTLIKMILGLSKVDKGTIWICGNNIKSSYPAVLKDIGALIEGPAFYDYMSAYDNLKIFGSYSKKVDSKHILSLLELVGLENCSNKKVSNFSLGMKQRLGIAQALLNNPKFIILDEPINGLDPQGIRDIRRILRYLSKEKNITILISSHILSELEQVCNRVLIFNKGKTLYEGDIDSLKDKTPTYEIEALNIKELENLIKDYENVTINTFINNDKVILSLLNDVKPYDLLYQLIISGIKVTSFTKKHHSLEEKYFSLIDNGAV